MPDSKPAPPYENVAMPERFRDTPYKDLPAVLKAKVDAAQKGPA